MEQPSCCSIDSWQHETLITKRALPSNETELVFHGALILVVADKRDLPHRHMHGADDMLPAPSAQGNEAAAQLNDGLA
jgi:hypothetical protein